MSYNTGYHIILDGIVTVNGERVMSGKSESLTFANREDAVNCFRYYHRIPIGSLAPYIPWTTFFDPRTACQY